MVPHIGHASIERELCLI